MLQKLALRYFNNYLISTTFVCIFIILLATQSKAQNWIPIGLPNSTRTSDYMMQNISTAIHTNGDMFMAYHGQYTSVYVRKLNRTTGIWEDIRSFSPMSGGAIATAIAITKDGLPIVAVKQWGTPWNILVYKIGPNNQLEQLGGFNGTLYSQYQANRISLALDQNDVPYIMYQSTESAIFIKKLQNNEWIDIGNQSIGIRNNTDYIKLLFDHNNVPTICYSHNFTTNTKNVVVSRLNGATWQNISNQLLVGWGTRDVLFDIDRQNVPYVCVVHQDGITLKRLGTDQNWTDASALFSGISDETFMHIDKDNNIYISGIRNSNIRRLSVAKFNRQAGYFEFVGTPHFTGITYENTLLSDREGKISLICTDRNVRPYMSTRTFNPSNNTWEIIDNPGIDATRTERIVNVMDRNMIPHVAYSEKTGRKAAVRKLNGTVWSNLGPEGFSTGTVEGISMTFDSQGVPFVCFSDGDHERKATVMRYNQGANSWQVYGAAGFSEGGVKDPFLNINRNDEMFITFIDEARGNRISTMKYNPSNQVWNYLGGQGFSSPAKSIATTFDNQGNPVIAYVNHNDELTSVRWNDNTWTNIGTGNATTSRVAFPSIAIDPNNNVIVGYKDLETNKASVSKNIISDDNFSFNKSGPEWVSIGEIEENEHNPEALSIAVEGNGTPYIAYIEKAQNSRAVIKRFHNNSWKLVGEQGHLSSGGLNQISLVISETGQLYAAYNANGIFMQSFDTGVLPIRLSSFTAKKALNTITLNWQTQMERDNKGFEIERKHGEQQFKTIGFVSGNNIPSNYSFIDKQPKASVNYYRLKQLDFNGNHSYSDVVSVNLSIDENMISVYPNPASNYINITNIDQQQTAIIYNASGQKVKEIKISGNLINIQELKNGVYFIVIAGKKIKFIKA
ncbi:MAG: T9SS type A sorting domain-containing protein [Pedobacter sp.]|uniref:T9SS type A sorting domain-containing protein n=1 Tax=Pedobacter sp. TaxID=1411316 RepID=UPI0028075D4A|nr:T9SS type A sorting domain-containing protein [Pedobacter sp.]MDQ8003499.1 T9SS type A sorting domain-containing protein [Pedobacter sp.]